MSAGRAGKTFVGQQSNGDTFNGQMSNGNLSNDNLFNIVGFQDRLVVTNRSFFAL